MKEKSFHLTVALVLSAMLHVGLIAHLSGVGWFGLAHPGSDRIIDVDLSPESPRAKEAAKSPAGRPVREKEEGRSPGTAAVGTPPAIESENMQPKAEAPQPDTSAFGKDGSPVSTDKREAGRAGGTTTEDRTAAAPEGEKSEEKGPLLMTVPREKFRYDISWAGIHVGQAVLEASNENGDIRITSRVRSAAVISFFYKVEDFSESRIVNGLPAHFRIKQHEGKYRSDKDTVFDGTDGEITFYNYLKNTMEEHRIKGNLPWDVMSGFYYLRTLPLVQGQTVFIDVFDSGKFLRVAVNVVRKEKIDIRGLGEVDTVMVRLLLASDGLFKSKGNVSIWLTDDDRRIPVRVETKVPLGSVTAELSSMERGS